MATSTKTKRRNAAQLAADAFAAIVEKLGMAEAVRYVQLYHHGAGNYSSERHDWLDQISHDQIVELMQKAAKTTAKKRPTRKTRETGR